MFDQKMIHFFLS